MWIAFIPSKAMNNSLRTKSIQLIASIQTPPQFTLKLRNITLDILFLSVLCSLQGFIVVLPSNIFPEVWCFCFFFKAKIMYFSVLCDSFRLSLPKSALLTTPHTVCRGPGSLCVRRECVCKRWNVCVCERKCMCIWGKYFLLASIPTASIFLLCSMCP